MPTARPPFPTPLVDDCGCLELWLALGVMGSCTSKGVSSTPDGRMTVSWLWIEGSRGGLAVRVGGGTISDRRIESTVCLLESVVVVVVVVVFGDLPDIGGSTWEEGIRVS